MPDHALFTSKNSSKQICWRILMLENNRDGCFSLEDYGFWPEATA